MTLVLCALSMAVVAQAAGPSDEVRLMFVGDVMIGRWIGELIEKYGSEYPLQPAHPFLRGADIAFGNLESPLTTAPYLRRGYNLVANPAHVSSLVLAGFDVMGLGNNHITDHGSVGITQTVQTLEEAGIAYVGAGTAITEAHRSWIGEMSSVRVAYLAYDSTWGSVPATESRAGSAHPGDRVIADVGRARQEADIVVVSVHWGQEYESLPNKQQQGYALQLARAGADIIVGHHPHVVQPLEWLSVPGRDSPTLLAYSLGNFIFDQEFSEETSESAILDCEVGPEGVRNARLIPVHIRHGQARPVSSRQSEDVLSRL
ncbi:MAG: CapA family protein, partial [Longimicrobiales bacterium]|nr:CapA family protein [Longimicrobiales bacterium]